MRCATTDIASTDARGPARRPAAGRRPRGGSDRSPHGGRPRRARRRDPRPVREACRVDVAGDRGDRTHRGRARGGASRSPTGGASCPRWSRCGSGSSGGELGQVLHVVCAQWDGAPPPPQFRRSSGGAFVDMGVHEFDVIRWLTGQSVASVVAVQTPRSTRRPARTPTTPRPCSASPVAPPPRCRSAGTTREATS